jgi:hypothetical protein
MISIKPWQSSYAPGEAINATITLRLDKPMRARGITAKLYCHEQKQVKTNVVLDKYEFDRDKEMGNPYVSHMETKTEIRQRDFLTQVKKVGGGDEYSSGEYTVMFLLPPNAPPTSHEFGHDGLIHIWRLKATLDIPLALDENDEVEINVSGL